MVGSAGLTVEEFAAAVARLGPFEPKPHLAVAVSGGPDSLALALLADAWARSLGGTVTALTVDHGLRPESAAEAMRVGAWLAGRGMGHRVLRWDADKPASGIQAAARDARYRLLAEWCRRAGVLHLLLGHHRDDQAETVLLRLARGSGVDGLAAMAPITEIPACRLLRPLLQVPRSRLRAVVNAAGQPFVEDPSNDSTAFARVRLRRLQPRLAEEGLTPERLSATAARMGRARDLLSGLAAEAAVAHVRLHPALWAEVEDGLLRQPDEVALRVLSRLLMVVGGRAYAPRLEALERLMRELRQGVRGRTLAGCRMLPRRGGFRVVRETAAVAPEMTVRAGDVVRWDGRFRAWIDGPSGLEARLGAVGEQALPRPVRSLLPAAVRAALPALSDRGGILCVPHLGYKRSDAVAALRVARLLPDPRVPLVAIGHCLV